MPALRAWPLLALASLATLVGCKPKASAAQCDALIERYARMIVTERFPDAGPERVKAEQDRERAEARGDDAFKNCSSEVSRTEYECAMHAATADAFEKCLE